VKIGRVEGIGYLYSRLVDQQSKELLVKLFLYRTMGHRKVKLPRNSPEYWSGIKRVASLPIAGEPLHLEFMNATLELRDLSSLGFSLRVYCTPTGGSYSFVQKQYELRRPPISCQPEQGDVVIDAGACWGETTLYFAHEVGPTGGVVAFEFIPKNIDVLEQNIIVNPEIAERITVVKQPVWSVSGETLYYVDWGPGSRVSFEKIREDFADTKCVTTTIDDTVTLLALNHVDFIKMDIEGAELHALKGAANTIRKFHPRLAISLYHSIHDFQKIPPYIDSLGIRYDFYLEHHTIFENETVLFCIPIRDAAAVSSRIT
jgi:FkbM family methyltransferase